MCNNAALICKYSAVDYLIIFPSSEGDLNIVFPSSNTLKQFESSGVISRTTELLFSFALAFCVVELLGRNFTSKTGPKLSEH